MALFLSVLEMCINETYHDFLVLSREFKSVKIGTVFDHIPEAVYWEAS